MTPPPTADEIAQLRRLLLKKGAEINDKLTRLLAGEKLDLEKLLGGARPGESPIDRLRRFMALVDGRLRAIRDGTYGRCEQCGDGLPFAHLEQVPWIDTCQACAARAGTATAT